MSLDLSSDELYRVFVTLFELVKPKRGTHQSWWGKWEGNHFVNNGSCFSLPLNMALVYTIMSVNWVFNWSLWRSSFMSHANPLSFFKRMHCPLSHSVSVLSSHAAKSFCHAARCSKGIWRSFTSAVYTAFVSISLSHSYGYYIHIFPELCSKFRVVDVGLIMALLRRDFSRRHQLIILEIVLNNI